MRPIPAAKSLRPPRQMQHIRIPHPPAAPSFNRPARTCRPHDTPATAPTDRPQLIHYRQPQQPADRPSPTATHRSRHPSQQQSAAAKEPLAPHLPPRVHPAAANAGGERPAAPNENSVRLRRTRAKAAKTRIFQFFNRRGRTSHKNTVLQRRILIWHEYVLQTFVLSLILYVKN